LFALVPARERRLERSAWLMQRDLVQLGNDLRQARIMAGQTLRAVAARIGTSPSSVLRTERARFPPGASPESIARHAAAVGMRARIKVYPEGPPIRDAAQIDLIRAFQARLAPETRRLFRLEQPVTTEMGDLRGFDATMEIAGGVGLEFISRFYDCQAQLRAAHLKQRDSGIARLIFVVKDTHANRRAINAVRDVIQASYPFGTRRVMAALVAGRDPGANGVVFL
jgi:transcriptional regulator with XRE-family HTH domain